MFIVVTTTEDTTRKDFVNCLLILLWTWRSIHMGLMTHGPCPIKVSGVVVKCHWYVGIVFWLRGNAMVNYTRDSHIAMYAKNTKTLTY